MTEHPKPETNSLSIVVVGNFNPTIFHPLWFEKFDMFSSTEIKKASENTVEAVHREMTIFRIGWCQFQLTPRRFIVSTQMDPYYNSLKDLVLCSFSELPHTPIEALGINPDADFNLDKESRWHSLGHLLAPKEPWSAISKAPGLKELVIKDTHDDRDPPGYTLTKVAPAENENIDYGVYIQLNEHFQLNHGADTTNIKKLLDTLSEHYEPTMEKWKKTYTHLINLV